MKVDNDGYFERPLWFRVYQDGRKIFAFLGIGCYKYRWYYAARFKCYKLEVRSKPGIMQVDWSGSQKEALEKGRKMLLRMLGMKIQQIQKFGYVTDNDPPPKDPLKQLEKMFTAANKYTTGGIDD